MPKNLTLVVVTPKRLGALPVVIIINRLAMKELTVQNLEAWLGFKNEGQGQCQEVTNLDTLLSTERTPIVEYEYQM